MVNWMGDLEMRWNALCGFFGVYLTFDLFEAGPCMLLSAFVADTLWGVLMGIGSGLWDGMATCLFSLLVYLWVWSDGWLGNCTALLPD